MALSSRLMMIHLKQLTDEHDKAIMSDDMRNREETLNLLGIWELELIKRSEY